MTTGSTPSASEIEKELQKKQSMHRFLSKAIKNTTRASEKAKLRKKLKQTENELQELKSAFCRERHGPAGRETRAYIRQHTVYL